MIDPTLYAGIELGEADSPLAPGLEAVSEPAARRRDLARLHAPMVGKDDEAEPGYPLGNGRDLGSPVDELTGLHLLDPLCNPDHHTLTNHEKRNRGALLWGICDIPPILCGDCQAMQILIKSSLPANPISRLYWRFAFERQNVFFGRLLGSAPPWTDDPIIRSYKFTNAYRVQDRTTQFLISEIINRDQQGDLSIPDRLFRILLFKLFNKAETWSYLEQVVGPLSWAEYSFNGLNRALNVALDRGTPIYSAAYIMPSAQPAFGHARKHQNHLRLLELMMTTGLADRITDCRSFAELYGAFLSYPFIGPFLAYQFATDINYSELTDFSENEFVMAGPGARDGIRKCFPEKGRYSDADVIRFMMESQEDQWVALGLRFKSFFGRPLHLIDCQNLFCEVGKYLRMSHPEIPDSSGRSRIKQVFRANADPLPLAFPRKWGLTEAVERFRALGKAGCVSSAPGALDAVSQ